MTHFAQQGYKESYENDCDVNPKEYHLRFVSASRHKQKNDGSSCVSCFMLLFIVTTFLCLLIWVLSLG